jgi:hypothetical protein
MPVVAAAPVPRPPVPVSRPIIAVAPAVVPPAPVARPVIAAAPAVPSPAPAEKKAALGSDPSVFAVIPWPSGDSSVTEVPVSDEGTAPASPPPPTSPEATAPPEPAADDGVAGNDITASTQVQDEAPASSLTPSGEKIVLDQPKTKTGGRWTGCTKFKSYSAKAEAYRGLDGLLHECKAE